MRATTVLVVLIVLTAFTGLSLWMVYQGESRPDCCTCPTQGVESLLVLPSATNTPTPTATLWVEWVTMTSTVPTRTPKYADPTSTPRPPHPTDKPYWTREPTRTPIAPTSTPFIPPTQISTPTNKPSGLAHWHLKNENAKLYCVWSDKGHKPNPQWFVDYDDCMAAAGG